MEFENTKTLDELDWDWDYEEFLNEVNKILEEKFIDEPMEVTWHYIEPANWHFPAEYVEYNAKAYVDEVEEDGEQIYFHLREVYGKFDEYERNYWCYVPWEEFGLSGDQTPQQFIDTLRNVKFKTIADYIKANVEGDD